MGTSRSHRTPSILLLGSIFSAFGISACGAAGDDLGTAANDATGGAINGVSLGGSGGLGASGAGGVVTSSSGGNFGTATGGTLGASGSGGFIGGGGSPMTGSGGSGGNGVQGAGGNQGSGGNPGSGGNAGSGGNPGSGGTGGDGGNPGSGGVTGTGGTQGTGGSTGSCTTAPAPSPLVGWASVENNGTRTTGGDGGPTTTVTTLSALSNLAKGTSAQIIQIRGTVDGDISIGSNKTLVGLCGAVFHGHISMSGSANVIIRNLTLVGKNCTDNSDCQSGDDTITVEGGSHHSWFDHDDISDGSDGNLDMTHAADFITISWTKFHYSGRRSGGHQFSNLIGSSDNNASEDTGHLRITFHHTWWADNAVERMPRVRFGRVHLFNDLYTSSGNNYCIGVGNGSNIRSENNVFIRVANPMKDYSTDGSGLVRSSGNVYTNTTGNTADIGTGTVFTPGYSVTLDPTSGLEAAIRAGAGPH